PVNLLTTQIPSIVRALHKQLKEKSVKTRQGCFHLLLELVAVLPGALSDHISAIVPGIQFSLGDKSSTSNMKIDTLAFLGCILAQHPPKVFHPHIHVLVPPVVTAVGDPFYKITSEALMVTQQLVKVIRPHGVPASEFEFRPYVKDIYQCTLVRLKAADIDQEVKERAISCMGQILCSLGDELSQQLPQCLPIFLDRLRNEITRLTTVKAYSLIAGSPLRIDLYTILGDSMPILASFLRKNQRALKLSTLTTLNVLVTNYGHLLSQENISGVLTEVPPLISESDLHISQLSLTLLTSVAKIHKDSMAQACTSTLPAIMVLIRSPLLQGGALNATLTLLTELVTSGIKGMGFKDLFQEIQANPKRQYLLLHSLKEVISCEAGSPTGVEALRPFISSIWTLLFSHCESTEEGTRNVVAECLGKLTLVDPLHLLPQLKDYLNSDSAFARSTVVTAVKFTISDHPQPIDSQLRGCIGDFLRTVQDPDLNVRRVALVTFNSAAHNKPSLIRDLLEQILPRLYNETKVRKELIREVEMGPFKHTVDDGLDIRKAAFECMYTLLDTCLDRLDIFEFLSHVEDGLKDHYDIKMLTFLMLVRLSSLCPNAILQRVDILVEPLRATLQTKVKANSVKQEFEKQDELKRSALRAVAALLSIPDSDKSPLLSEFLAQIKSSPELSAMFDSIQRDAGSAESMDTS
ncbi:hypothetical protein pdam_00017612, partial [Pocillopora damicornis]